MSSVCSRAFLPDPRCQLLSFHTFKQILWWYQVAWPSHGSPVGRQWEEALNGAGFPGCRLEHKFDPAPASPVGDGVKQSARVLIHPHLD